MTKAPTVRAFTWQRISIVPREGEVMGVCECSRLIKASDVYVHLLQTFNLFLKLLS